MLSLSQAIRVFVCTRPADTRRRFDRLCGMAENLMKQSPLSATSSCFAIETETA